MIHYVESEIVWGLHTKIELQKTMYMKTSVVNIYNRKKNECRKTKCTSLEGHSIFTLWMEMDHSLTSNRFLLGSWVTKYGWKTTEVKS